ncbi:PucR family transcriptional regulator [Pseudonocardia spinosispora]|uniref:PucR family transcriptional regulator n=1 Tax=Pseudonocardia spinosispora TaxID=103441 RepID=UPI000427B8C2|nr:helix-turn-helix domain-containing protein [Pseudonocardia spinosispora]
MATAPERSWHELLDVLLEQQAALTAEIRSSMQERLSSYHELDAEQFERHVAMAVDTTIRLAAVTPPRLSEWQTQVLEQVGEAQAGLGVPVEAMLLAWRIGADILMERGSELAAKLGIDDRELLAFVRGALASSDVGMITTARAHRRAELERDREAQDRRASFVRAVLFGTGEPSELRARAKSYGLDPTRRYRAVRVRTDGEGSWQQAERAIGLASAARAGEGMSVLVDGDLAGFLAREPGDVAPGLAGLGPAVPLERLAESFRLATRSLTTLHAFGLTGTRDLTALGLRAAVVADQDVGEALRDRYLAPLARSGSGPEIITTLRVYLAAGSHVETAAEQLHIHPNTLRYRLARFEDLADVRLREPLVAFEVWWAVESAAIDAG